MSIFSDQTSIEDKQVIAASPDGFQKKPHVLHAGVMALSEAWFSAILYRGY